jgi:hypothetical protein
MAIHQARLFSGLAAALLAVACSDLPPAPTPPPAPVASVTVSPGAPSIPVGMSVVFSATIKDDQGNTLSGRTVTWSSNAEAVATVDATGLVTGVSRGGPVNITATSEGHSGTAEITVTGIDAQSISVRLASTGASVWQGNLEYVRATLTRAGGYADSVDVTVTGTPPGVTATVDVMYPLAAAGRDYSVGFWVDPATLPGDYPLVIHATGRGVSEATASYLLTTLVPGIALTLSSPELTIVRGGASQATTVAVVRNHFTGPVTLHADVGDEEGSLPPGVSAVFAPNPSLGNSSALTFTVSAAATPGVYDLYVRGITTAGYSYSPLTLTITAP